MPGCGRGRAPATRWRANPPRCPPPWPVPPPPAPPPRESQGRLRDYETQDAESARAARPRSLTDRGAAVGASRSLATTSPAAIRNPRAVRTRSRRGHANRHKSCPELPSPWPWVLRFWWIKVKPHRSYTQYSFLPSRTWQPTGDAPRNDCHPRNHPPLRLGPGRLELQPGANGNDAQEKLSLSYPSADCG